MKRKNVVWVVEIRRLKSLDWEYFQPHTTRDIAMTICKQLRRQAHKPDWTWGWKFRVTRYEATR
jgi:hypothetical protein